MTFVFGAIFVVLALGISSLEFTGGVKSDTSPWALGFSASCAAVGAGDNAAANEHIETSLHEADSFRFGDGRQSLTHALSSLTHAAQGRHEDAKRSAERALVLLKYAGSSLAEKTAASAVYELIAASYSLQKLWGEAEPMLVQSLKLKEATFDPGSGEIRAGIEQLASVYRRLGRSGEADELCRRIPAAVTESADPNDLSDAENLGECIELLRRTFGAAYVGGQAGC